MVICSGSHGYKVVELGSTRAHDLDKVRTHLPSPEAPEELAEVSS